MITNHETCEVANITEIVVNPRLSKFQRLMGLSGNQVI